MFPTVARASLIVCLSAVIYAQTESTRPAFEVVSVKPTPPERLNLLKVERCKEGGPFITEGAPLLRTIEYAYRLNDSDLAGWPPWSNPPPMRMTSRVSHKDESPTNSAGKWCSRC